LEGMGKVLVARGSPGKALDGWTRAKSYVCEGWEKAELKKEKEESRGCTLWHIPRKSFSR